jgi:hypothetical protein
MPRAKAAPHPQTTAPPPSRFVFVLYHGADENDSVLDHLSGQLVMKVRRQLETLITEPQGRVEIDVWLESPGGDAHAAYKLALLLRSKANRLRVVVPDYAKSAATLLTLAADEIYMAPAAELGPLDAQIPREGGLVTTISALDIAKSVDDLVATAFNTAFERGAVVLQATRLTRIETLSLMLDFAAKFMEPIVRQLDPAMVHWSSSLLEVSTEYAERLIKMRHASTPAAKPNLARQLVSNYPTHGFVISREEARDRLGLPVRDLKDYDLSEKACTRHRAFEDSSRNSIDLLTYAEATK